MRITKFLIISCLVGVFNPLGAAAEAPWPEKMVQNMECLKRHGLIQGTVTDVLRGDAHFAPYDRPLAIGRTAPSIRPWQGAGAISGTPRAHAPPPRISRRSPCRGNDPSWMRRSS